jgi:hypothetical protein
MEERSGGVGVVLAVARPMSWTSGAAFTQATGASIRCSKAKARQRKATRTK